MSPRKLVKRYMLLSLRVGVVLASYLLAKAQTASNPQVGARIVAEGTKRGAIACSGCHGDDGLSGGFGTFPILAGQFAPYLVRQLQSYASGQRKNTTMEPIAKGLTENEMNAVAQYYANVKPPVNPTRAEPPDLITEGKQLALTGDSASRVENCISCHGPNGDGDPPYVPFLSGQYKGYIKAQILAFKKGDRKAAPMEDVGHNLPEQHIDAIAAYFDQLQLPSHK